MGWLAARAHSSHTLNRRVDASFGLGLLVKSAGSQNRGIAGPAPATFGRWECGYAFPMPSQRSSILLIADPGAPAVIAERLSDSLPNALTGEPADDTWDVSVRRHAYPIDEHTEVSDVLGTIEPDGEAEDIVIYLTDLPRRRGTTPVVADISVPDRFGMISIPGLGGAFIDRRVRTLAQTVVAEVTGQSREQHRSVKRLTRTQEDDVVRYVAPSALSRLQLLAGMVYANRPWRLVRVCRR